MSGTLNHLPSDIIRQLLIDLSLGTDGGATWPIYSTSSPNEPDDVIVVVQTESIFQGRDMNSGESQEFYGFNISVRHDDVVTAGDKSQDIVFALDNTVDRDVVSMTTPTNTYQIEATTRTGAPLPLGKEQSGGRRELYSINLKVSMYQLS